MKQKDVLIDVLKTKGFKSYGGNRYGATFTDPTTSTNVAFVSSSRVEVIERTNGECVFTLPLRKAISYFGK
jgi:hypothetical protein